MPHVAFQNLKYQRRILHKLHNNSLWFLFRVDFYICARTSVFPYQPLFQLTPLEQIGDSLPAGSKDPRLMYPSNSIWPHYLLYPPSKCLQNNSYLIHRKHQKLNKKHQHFSIKVSLKKCQVNATTFQYVISVMFKQIKIFIIQGNYYLLEPTVLPGALATMGVSCTGAVVVTRRMYWNLLPDTDTGNCCTVGATTGRRTCDACSVTGTCWNAT